MRLTRRCMLIATSLVGGLTTCKAVEFPTPPVQEFQATLAGSNEVPPVTTSATGSVQLAVTLDTFLIYRLDVAGIDSPTVAHMHEGAAGVGGAIIVTLYAGPTKGLAFTGELVGSQLKASQLTQLPAGYGADPKARLDSLIALMRSGGVYVNVHTRVNPGGAIRGQVQAQ